MTGDSDIELKYLLGPGLRNNSGALLDLELTIPGRGLCAVFGPSGAGKTTLLRCIAGLLRADQGRLRVRGKVWEDGRRYLPTHKRPLAYVFQEPSLFGHLTAEGNLRFASKRCAMPAAPDYYDRVVAAMDIADLLSQYPASLSGGEQQRVAIARALLIQPRWLLMDEPLASLDQTRKREIMPYLEDLHREFDIPVLYVSHSIDEVARLADHLLLLDEGRVEASGDAPELLSRIDSSLQSGDEAGVVIDADVIEIDSDSALLHARFNGGALWLRRVGEMPGDRVRLRIFARDVSIALTDHSDSSILNRLPATVAGIVDDRDDGMVLVQLQLGETCLIARITRRSLQHLQLHTGLPVWLQIKSVAILR